MKKNTENEVLLAINNMAKVLESLDSRISKLEKVAIEDSKTVAKTTKSTNKTTPKKSTKTSTKSSTKSSSKTSKKSTDFDRAEYERIAKELGVFYRGRVCATVENGEVVYTRQENRQRVYEMMGI